MLFILADAFKHRSATIDSILFRVNYFATALFLLAASLFLAARQYLGTPITCKSGYDGYGSMSNNYCLSHIFTVSHSPVDRVGIDVAHPGVRPTTPDKKYVDYYQWVCFCLLFQAILFYLPGLVWKHWEGGKVAGLKKAFECTIVGAAEKQEKMGVLVDYFYHNLNAHNLWAASYLLCEIFSFVNIIGQWYLLNWFLGPAFYSYGSDVSTFPPKVDSDKLDPELYLFPQMAKCTMHEYSSNGEISIVDSLCNLPLNFMNAKLFLVLWYWLIVLGVFTFLLIIYRICVLAPPSRQLRALLLLINCNSATWDSIVSVTARISPGNWQLLYLLSQNMDSILVKEVVENLARRMKPKGKDSHEMENLIDRM